MTDWFIRLRLRFHYRCIGVPVLPSTLAHPTIFTQERSGDKTVVGPTQGSTDSSVWRGISPGDDGSACLLSLIPRVYRSSTEGTTNWTSQPVLTVSFSCWCLLLSKPDSGERVLSVTFRVSYPRKTGLYKDMLVRNKVPQTVESGKGFPPEINGEKSLLSPKVLCSIEGPTNSLMQLLYLKLILQYFGAHASSVPKAWVLMVVEDGNDRRVLF